MTNVQTSNQTTASTKNKTTVYTERKMNIVGVNSTTANSNDDDNAEFLWNEALYGTWTFTTQTMTDLGYYKGRAYFVMNLMPNPLRRIASCHLHGHHHEHHHHGDDPCVEYNNQLCIFRGDDHAHAHDENLRDASDDELSERKPVCVDTQSTVVDWSDAVAFFQFGVQIRTGIAWKSYIFSNTSDWLGPYNLVMATTPPGKPGDLDDGVSSHSSEESSLQSNISKQHSFDTRYVTTEATLHDLRRPSGSTLITQEAFDVVAGPAAVNHTIFFQNGKPISSTGQDPYAPYAGTCDRGDLQPILPRLHARISTDINDPHNIRSMPHLQVEYSILSTPDKKLDKTLYKLWPSLKKHLGSDFPLTGPYCYGNDPNRAYTVRLSYDSRDPVRSKTWQVIKGCVEGLPCWDDGRDRPVVPFDNGSSGTHIVDPTGWISLVCYLLGFLLVISLVFNVQLSNQLRRIQRRANHPSNQDGPTSSSLPSSGRRLYSRDEEGEGMTEPLLPSTNTEDHENNMPSQPQRSQVQFSSSEFDALDTESRSPDGPQSQALAGGEATTTTTTAKTSVTETPVPVSDPASSETA